MRTPQYDLILQNMAGSDERAVYAVLCHHVGADNRITREQLGRQVFGKYNVTVDRTVRLHIANMRMNGHVICSDSGRKGYYLPETKAEVNDYVMEQESRARKIWEGIRMTKIAAAEAFDIQPQMRMEI